MSVAGVSAVVVAVEVVLGCSAANNLKAASRRLLLLVAGRRVSSMQQALWCWQRAYQGPLS